LIHLQTISKFDNMGYFDKKNNWLVILLVVLNLALLASIWFKPKPPRHHLPDIALHLQKQLDLTAEQTQQFKELRKENFEQTRPLLDLMRSNKQAMIEALGQAPPDTLKAKQLAKQIAQQQQGIEEALIQHYLALKEVCTPQQQQGLNELFLEAMKPKGPQKKK